MTSDIEKQFFEIFNICNCNDCIKKNDHDLDCLYLCENKYPELTDRILLELILTMSNCLPYYIGFKEMETVEQLKNDILKECIRIISNRWTITEQHKEIFKNKVQNLFDGKDKIKE